MSETTRHRGTTLSVQGVEVPRLGLGTWQIQGDACREAVRHALELGYRHIDTARAYDNEREVGEGLAASGVPREDVFLTTKLWLTELEPRRVARAAEHSLRRLGTEYVDLLLIHWPSRDVPVADTLAAMAELRERGLVRNLGVSNYPATLLREALGHAPLLADQVEFHPYLGQPELLALARERDLLVTAYSPLAGGELLEDPVLAEIARDRDVMPAQVVLAWLLDQPQVAVIPKAASAEKREQNLAALDLRLSDAEKARVAGLERGRRVIDPSFAPDWHA